MTQYEIIDIIFTTTLIKKLWIFRADVNWYETSIDLERFPDTEITWNSGTWHDGIWEDGYWDKGKWENGTWMDGTWIVGTWLNGIWKGGTWKNGTWEDGIWEDGKWVTGTWKNGIWKGGKWNGGYIYNHEIRKYKFSQNNPNECKWSLSYRRYK